MLKIPALESHSIPFARLGNLVLAIYLGLALGYLATSLFGNWLAQTTEPTRSSVAAPQVDSHQARITDFANITERNIFDPNPPPPAPLKDQQPTTKTQPAPRAQQANLKLLGTVVAGNNSLALISGGGKSKTYRLGDPLPGKSILQQVSRFEALVERSDGSEQRLLLLSEKAKSNGRKPANKPASKPRSGYGSGQNSVRAIGVNRFEIDKNAITKARQDMGALIKQMRVEPYIQEGKTTGFLVKWIQPGSLLGQLGLRRGDIIAEVNRVPLDSPEKALMIFQQLREARALSIGLNRRGQRQQLQYDIK